MYKFIKLLLLTVVLPFLVHSQQYKLEPMVIGSNTSIRGLSVVDENIIWVSGSKGYIGKSLNGGKTWEWMQPKGYEKLDFRDIQAFDRLKAILVNAGSPAYILSTIDGGKTWRETYKNIDSAIFLDGMDFWDSQQGIVFGDPIKNKMQLLRTQDGGLSWQNISDRLKQNLAAGEAGFAASGTSIKALPDGKVWIATGGTVAKVYFSPNYGNLWKVYDCPIMQGESSTGTFSIDFYNERKGIAVGGNYLKDKDNTNNILITKNGGRTWKKPVIPVFGFRSGVVYINENLCFATGTSGTDLSVDGGKKWMNISSLGFNVIKSSPNGKLIVLAGGKGQIYRLNMIL
jgi:photosystem II stability/assembly factor-like uncharacterized protein